MLLQVGKLRDIYQDANFARWRHIFLVFWFLFFIFSPGIPPCQAEDAAVSELTGRLLIISSMRPRESNLSPVYHYRLVGMDGTVHQLHIADEMQQEIGRLRAMDRRLVRLQVTPLRGLGKQNQAVSYLVHGLLASSDASEDATSEANMLQAEADSIVAGTHRWISIACKFSDESSEPKDLAYFQNMYAGSYPGLDHYWREVSYNIANIEGSTATGWYTLPYPRSHYVYDGSLDFDRAAQDCTALADPVVYFPAYEGINLMFNDDLDGYAWGGSNWMTLDGVSGIWSMTWEPPWGYSDICVMAHEMGHGFGLPHSSGDYGQVYDNVWDVMSDTWTNCAKSRHSVYGCLGQHTIAYHKDKLGWISSSEQYTVPYVGYGAPVAVTLSADQSVLLARIPVMGSSSHFYTVELRNRSGYDIKLPGDAVILHEVITSREEPAHVVDNDNNGETGDAGAMWLVGETFQNTLYSISVSVLAASGSKYQVRIVNGQQEATLWLDPLAEGSDAGQAVFADVAEGYWAQDQIETLYSEGITVGCSTSPLNYCPAVAVTRAEMAVFLEKAVHGAAVVIEDVDATFNDTAGHWAEDWIEALHADGIITGYGDGNYYPDTSITRAEMAVLLLKSMHGSAYEPPAATQTFSDTAGHWAEAWIDQLALEGVTSGCGSSLFCPDAEVTRDQMAVFLVNAFEW